jgi:hypothetical protein
MFRQVFALLLLPISVAYPKEDEVAVMEYLIEATEKNLLMQKVLKEKILLFSEQKERFMLGEQSKQYASQMVRTAFEIYEIVKEHRLQYLFTSQYLEELALFSSIARKSYPTRP